MKRGTACLLSWEDFDEFTWTVFNPLLDPSVAHGRKVFSILACAHSPANYQLLRHLLKYAGPHRDIAKAPLADKSRMDGWETTKLTIGQAESLAIILPRSCNESYLG